VLLGIVSAASAEEGRGDALGDPLPERAVGRLGTIRLRTSGAIEDVVFSPDGKRAAVWYYAPSPSGPEYLGSYDGLSIHELSTGKELQNTPLGPSRLESMAWRADGHLLAVIRQNHHEKWRYLLCDAAIPSFQVHVLENLSGRMILGPSGEVLAIYREGKGTDEHTIEMWQLIWNEGIRQEKLLHRWNITLPYAQEKAPQAADGRVLFHEAIQLFSPDGKSLVTLVPWEKSRREGWRGVVWDLTKGIERRRFYLPPDLELGTAHSAAASNRQAAVGCVDGTIFLFDLDSNKSQRWPDCHKPLGAFDHKPGVNAMAFTSAGTALVTVGRERILRVWRTSDGKKLREFARPDPWTKALSFSRDGRLLALGGVGKTLRVLDADTNSDLLPLPGHQAAILGLAVTGDGTSAITSGADQKLRVWDIAKQRQRREIPLGGFAWNCALTLNDKAVLVGEDPDANLPGGPLHLYSLDGNEVENPALLGAKARDVRYTQDGRTLVTVHVDKVDVRDWPSGNLRRRLALPPPWGGPGFQAIGRMLALSSDGRYLLTRTSHDYLAEGVQLDSEGGSLDVWDLNKGSRRNLGRTGLHWECGAFTPNGELILAADPDIVKVDKGQLHVLSMRTWHVKRSFGKVAATAVAVSADGRAVYSGGPDGTIYAFEMVCIATIDLRRAMQTKAEGYPWSGFSRPDVRLLRHDPCGRPMGSRCARSAAHFIQGWAAIQGQPGMVCNLVCRNAVLAKQLQGKWFALQRLICVVQCKPRQRVIRGLASAAFRVQSTTCRAAKASFTPAAPARYCR
jgi:WD40 repeat protein